MPSLKRRRPGRIAEDGRLLSKEGTSAADALERLLDENEEMRRWRLEKARRILDHVRKHAGITIPQWKERRTGALWNWKRWICMSTKV